MNELSIMKELDLEMTMPSAEEFQKNFSYKKSKVFLKKRYVLSSFALILICFGFLIGNLKITNMETGDTISLVTSPIAATTTKKDIISIPTGIVKANPFVPYRSIGSDAQLSKDLINDIPKYDLISPPEALSENSEANKMLSTVVSGILYDKYSPSAILNIGGSDYLVKKGDTVSKYKVISIEQNSVTVKSGKNTYTAGIGELITDGSVNYNDISDLDKKFGGKR